jgi:Flp pilus assembly protein protease CpaA
VTDLDIEILFMDDIKYLNTLSSYLGWLSITLVFIGGFLQITKLIIDHNERILHKQSLSKYIQWFAVSLIFISGFLQIAKFTVDRHEKALADNPYMKPILTGTSEVKVILASEEQVNAHYIDQGGYLAFGRYGQPILLMSSIDCFAQQTGKDEVIWKGIFNLDASDNSINKPISYLANAQIVQIGFAPMPKEAKVKGGVAIITINNSIRIELKIPEQDITNGLIIIGDLGNTLSKFQ